MFKYHQENDTTVKCWNLFRATCSKTHSKHSRQLYSKLDHICRRIDHLTSQTSSHITQMSNFTSTSKTIKTFKSIVIEKRKTVTSSVTSSDSKKTSERLHRKAARVSAKITSSKKGTNYYLLWTVKKGWPDKKYHLYPDELQFAINFINSEETCRKEHPTIYR